jgi:hypothetical protein
MLRKMVSAVPKGPYVFVIDAGPIGTYQNANILSDLGRGFVISMTPNKFPAAFSETLQPGNSFVATPTTDIFGRT